MTKKKYICLLLFILLSSLTLKAEENNIEFDIKVKDNTISIWFNLSSFLTSSRIEDMKEGNNYSIYGSVTLKKSKKIWGSSKLGDTEFLYNLSYRILTKDYFLEQHNNNIVNKYTFTSPAQFHRFFTDSITVNLTSDRKFDNSSHYFLEINLDYINSGLNRFITESRMGDNNSPLRFLFSAFLDITGVGKTTQTFRTPPFRINDFITNDSDN